MLFTGMSCGFTAKCWLPSPLRRDHAVSIVWVSIPGASISLYWDVTVSF